MRKMCLRIIAIFVDIIIQLRDNLPLPIRSILVSNIQKFYAMSGRCEEIIHQDSALLDALLL